MTMRVWARWPGEGLARHLCVLLVTAAAVLAIPLGTAAQASAAVPAHTDVMFLFDTSGSMGGQLQEAKDEMLKVMSNVNATLPDVHYGVAELRDYAPSIYSEGEEPGVMPWQLDQALTSDLTAVQKAIEPLHAEGGGDSPESYGRALWETDTNPNVGWREGTQHVIILIADNVPHDKNLNEGLPESAWVEENPFDTGEELPGTWNIPGTVWTAGVNLDFQSIMSQLALDGRPLEDVDFSGSARYLPYWEYWASLSGGHALGAKTGELAAKITTLIETGATTTLTPCPAGQARNGAGVCVAMHPTATQVICNLVIATATDTCTATVGDAAAGGQTNPTGTVSFTSANGGVFSAGSTCTLTPSPGTTSSCSVQFVPPTASSALPAITASYSGDASHNPSSAQTHYGPLSELAKEVDWSEVGTIRPDGSVEIPVDCGGFPCALSGELVGGPDLASLSAFGGGSATVSATLAGSKAKHKSKKKKKPAVLGKGKLKLSKGGKGKLVIKLSSKAKHALKKAGSKGARVTLKVTIKTLAGSLVGTETKHVKLRPQKKKKGHSKHR